MPYYCTVPRCTSMAGKAKNVSFHQFPRDEELARLWNDVLKRGKPYTKYSKVCSLHFKPEDYTITSVGKNKGQWRTLRKDAVPSQNLPSETPLPYSRKQWDNWSQSGTPNAIDPSVQSVQVAQAIYMQTMLAMQAAGTTDPSILHNGPALPESPHTSTEDKNTSYKCTECTKCFKDPDVFLLHKRSHTKDNGTEKENFNMNVTLRSNPILANLLKTNNENNFDPNVISMENLLMTALAANMDYIRNFSMVKDSDREYENDRSDFSHDRSDLTHSRVGLTHSRGDMTHSRGDLTHSRGDLTHPRGDLTHCRSDSGQSNLRHGSDLSNGRSDLSHVRSDLSHSESTNYGTTDLHNAMHELSQLRSEFNHSSGDSNNLRDLDPERDGNVIGKLKFSKDLSISVIERNFNDNGLKKDDATNQGDLNSEGSNIHAKNDQDLPKSDSNLDNSDSNHKSDSIHTKSDLNFSNNKDPPSFEMDSSSKNNGNLNGFYKETYFSTENNDSTDNNDTENNDEPNCDNDLNESMDSSDLVIDES